MRTKLAWNIQITLYTTLIRHGAPALMEPVLLEHYNEAINLPPFHMK